MLQVIQPSGPMRLFPAGGQACHTRIQGERVYHGVGIAVCLTLSSLTTSSLSGRIVSTPSDYLVGENDCDHHNYDGVIFPVSSLSCSGGVTVYEKSQDYPYDQPFYRVDDRITSTTFSHLVTYGQGSSEFSTYPTCDGSYKLTGGTTYFGYCTFMLRDVMYTAISSYIGGDSNGSYICFSSLQFDPVRGTRFYRSEAYGNVPIKSLSELRAWVSTRYWDPSGSFNTSVGTLVSFDTKGTGLDYTSLLSHVYKYIDASVPFITSDFRELSYQCVQQMQTWDSNGLALSKEIIGLKKEILSILKLIKGAKDPKNWASVFLSDKYGLKLTIRDSIELIKTRMSSQAHIGFAKVSSSTHQTIDKCDYEYHYSIYYEKYANIVGDIYYALADFDLLPSLENVWDLIPYTFIADWFINFGDLFDRLDSVNMLSAYNTAGDMRSVKASRTFTARQLGFTGCSGSVRVIHYKRWTTNSIAKPRVALDVSILNGFDHWVEAGALIIQKII